MAKIPGKKITELANFTGTIGGNNYFVTGNTIGTTNTKISGFSMKRDFSGNESKTIDAFGEISILNGEPVNLITVDAFGGAASDDLVKINGGHVGQLVILQSTNSARTVVIKNTANIVCAGADFSLDNTADKWMGIVIGDKLIHEISRSNNV